LLGVVGDGWGHEREDPVQGGAADYGEAVDVAEVELAASCEGDTEEEGEEDGSSEICMLLEILRAPEISRARGDWVGT
jgi:hypothetical protein